MKTKKFQRNTKKFGLELKKIETINGSKKFKCGKDFLKIRLKSNHCLRLNKPIKLHLLTIIIRSVFSEDGKCYPQLFLDDSLYEL